MSFSRCTHGSPRIVLRILCLFSVSAAWACLPTRACAAEAISAQNALRELRGFREMGSVLYVAAHPDDENTQLIAYLARPQLSHGIPVAHTG